MSSSHVRNLYKICIIIKNPYIPGTSDLQIDWRLKFKCSHWAAPLRAWTSATGDLCMDSPSMIWDQIADLIHLYPKSVKKSNHDELCVKFRQILTNCFSDLDHMWYTWPMISYDFLPAKFQSCRGSSVACDCPKFPARGRPKHALVGGGRKVDPLHWVMRDMVEASTLHLSILQIAHLLSPEMIMWGYVGKIKGRYLQRVMGSVSHVVWYLHSKRFSHRLPLANSDAEISWSHSRSLWLLTILPRCAGRFACLPFWTSLPICSK